MDLNHQINIKMEMECRSNKHKILPGWIISWIIISVIVLCRNLNISLRFKLLTIIINNNNLIIGSLNNNNNNINQKSIIRIKNRTTYLLKILKMDLWEKTIKIELWIEAIKMLWWIWIIKMAL